MPLRTLVLARVEAPRVFCQWIGPCLLTWQGPIPFSLSQRRSEEIRASHSFEDTLKCPCSRF